MRLRHKILLALCESMAVSRKIELAFVSHFHNLITKNNFKGLTAKKPRIFGNQMFVRVKEKYSTVLMLLCSYNADSSDSDTSIAPYFFSAAAIKYERERIGKARKIPSRAPNTFSQPTYLG